MLLAFARPLAVLVVLLVPAKHRGGTLRAFALAALAAIFLIASPSLRNSVVEGYETANGTLAQYAPYSYVGLSAAVLGGFLVFLSRGSGTR
jgi:hypothetical protein